MQTTPEPIFNIPARDAGVSASKTSKPYPVPHAPCGISFNFEALTALNGQFCTSYLSCGSFQNQVSGELVYDESTEVWTLLRPEIEDNTQFKIENVVSVTGNHILLKIIA